MISAPPDVLRVGHRASPAVRALAAKYRIELVEQADRESLPGSYWGESEAGLQGNRLFVRADTPLHSLLHELSHYVCMAADRRTGLDRDAGGDDDEESAVCFLQILLSDELPELGRARMFADMDAWGYTFRLGSARAWFEQDAADACIWLERAGVVSGTRPTFKLRS